MCRTRASAHSPPRSSPLVLHYSGRLLPFLSLSTASVSFAIAAAAATTTTFYRRRGSSRGAVPPFHPWRNSLHQPGATCRSMASCRWLVEPVEQPPSHASRSLAPRSATLSRRLFHLFRLLLNSPLARAFASFLFTSREKTRRAYLPSRRVDPIREGELFL